MNTNAKKIVKIGGLCVFFILIVTFGFFGAKNLILGVKITNVNITDGATVTEPVLHITGNAKNAIHLLLNGREISIDQSGNFNETIALLPGYNVIDIRAQDKFNHVDDKNYKLIYKE